jgi:hypothetical protein
MGAQGSNGAIGSTFVDYAKVTDINGISIEADDIETSNMDSPGAAEGTPWKEFTAGWADGGTVELKLQFDKTQADTIYGAFREDKSFRILFVDGSAWTFNGFIKKFGNEIEREKLVTVSATVKVSGEPLFAAAA